MGLSPLAPLASISGSAASAAISTVASAVPSWLTGKLAQVTVIGLGLLLVAAGIFSFKKTQEIIVQIGEAAGKAAAVAA